ncbi:MAG: hypothetical protein AAFV25_20320, partial [Bacteroidota bacterium]
QQIYHKRALVGEVEFPPHRDNFVLPALSCSDDPDDLNLTGRPMIAGREIDNRGRCELVVTKSDQLVDICSPGGYRILRNWSVIDWCSGDFTLGIQIIKVEDVNPPVLTLPADLVLGTSSEDCARDLSLPLASASDDCSAVSIGVQWEFGTGYGPFYNVPAGRHAVVYTAEDVCGNQAVDTLWVSIEDRTAPVAVCDRSLQISLSNGGLTEVAAASFDDGSFDYCSEVQLSVRRAGTSYGPSVHFDCADLLVDSVEVWLRVEDVAGNINECSSLVYLADVNRPALICPSEIRLECSQDVMDLTLTGQASVSDNCGIDSLYFTDQENLNDCGVGSILRIWHAIDLSGNHSSCTQRIVLEDSSPVSVQFPGDTTLTSCTTGFEPIITGQPQIEGANCEQLYTDYDDRLFDYGFPACYKIIRTWTVIDWCTYDPNSGSDDGRWVSDQVISVYDTEAPIIFCNQIDTIVQIYSADCQGAYVELLPATAQDCNPNLQISNDSPFADANGANASGVYPVGTHLITFRAIDGCDNQSSCSFQLIVRDAKPPTPVCIPSLTLDLPVGGLLVPDPRLFDLGSTDNCTDAADLVFRLEPESFDCDQIGQQIVELVVTDADGNSSICTSTLTIRDGNRVCPFSNIGGSIENENGLPIQKVSIVLSGGMDSIQQVASDGTFLFEKMTTDLSYTVDPQKNTDYKNGISTYDLVLLSQHILGIRPLNSPYKIIAADANNSGSVTALDMVEVRKLILGLEQGFQRNTSWRFVRADYNFPLPNQPFRYSFPEVYSIERLEEDVLNADFVGIKIGDVNNNHNPANVVGGVEERSGRAAKFLLVEDWEVEAGEQVRVAVKAGDLPEALGFQFGFRYESEALEPVDILYSHQAVQAGLGESQTAMPAPGQLTVSWHKAEAVLWPEGEMMMELVFEVKKDGWLSDFFGLSEEMMVAEAYDTDLQIWPLIVQYVDVDEKLTENLAIQQNFPNPFRSQTQIDFSIGEAATVQLYVADALGRVRCVQKDVLEAGEHSFSLDRNQLALEPGLYYYWMETSLGKTETLSLLVP